MASLKEKYGPTALITGASAGIGAAFATELAAQGMNLVLTARRQERLRRIAARLAENHGVRVHVYPLDLVRREAPGELAHWLAREGIEVGLLINNAGFGLYGYLGQTNRSAELAMVDLHCRAVVELTGRLLPGMLARGRGGVIILSSVLAEIPSPWMATYSATKAFDLWLGAALYGELKPKGIDVLAVMPTLTATEFHLHGTVETLRLRRRTPEQVVRTALRNLGRRPSVADGRFTRLWLFATRLIPQSWLLVLYRRFRKPPAPPDDGSIN